MLALAPLTGVRLTALLVVQVIGIELLMAVALTAFGMFVAGHIQRMEGFSVIMQLLLLLFPMLFLSCVLFPLEGLPSWLAVITRLNPLTYAADPLRHLVFELQHMPAAAAQRFATGVTLFGYSGPTAAELGITCVFAVVFLALAVSGFGKPESQRGRDVGLWGAGPRRGTQGVRGGCDDVYRSGEPGPQHRQGQCLAGRY